MHEYSIVASLIGSVERETALHGAARVHRIQLKIGEHSGVEVELLETAYETFREHTICEAAELCIERVAAVWACPRCGASIQRGAPLRCDLCKRAATMVQGDEIILQRIEMEADDV